MSCIQQLMASSSGLGSTSGNKRQFHLIFLGLPQLHLHISAKEALHSLLVAFLPLLIRKPWENNRSPKVYRPPRSSSLYSLTLGSSASRGPRRPKNSRYALAS